MEWYRKSLFTKLTYPLIALSTIAVILSYNYLNNSIRERAVLSAESSAVETVGQYKRLRKYYTENVVSEVVRSADLKLNYQHAGVNGVLPLPATVIHDLSALMQDRGTRVNLYSGFPFPNRKQRKLDDFQQASWDYLVANPTEIYTQTVEENGKTLVRVAISDTMVAQACVNCHNSHPETPRKGWKLGDVRGVLEVSSDIGSYLETAESTAIRTTVLTVILVSTLMTVMGFVFRHTGRKIDSFSAVVSQAKEGDLTARANLSGYDEIAQMGTQFNSFLETTEEVVSKMNKYSGDIDQLSNVLTTSVTENHQSILKQNSETYQVADSMLQMQSNVDEVSDSAAKASEAAESAMQETQSTLQVVNKTMTSIANLKSQITVASETIAELDNDSTEINSVLDVIRSIAEQTNLLALNAAIEAARAGDQGRGFAVVADEVRSLANRTEESIRDIQDKIEQLQKRAKDSVSIMDESSNAIKDSLSKAENAVTYLDSIDEIIRSVSELNISIATAAEQQSQVAKDVSQSANDLSEGNKKIETDASQVEQVAKDLNQLADKLSKAAKHFNT